MNVCYISEIMCHVSPRVMYKENNIVLNSMLQCVRYGTVELHEESLP